MAFLIEHGETGVQDLSHALEVPRTAVSKHLRELHDVGLVTCRRQGRATLYRVDGVCAEALVAMAIGHLHERVAGLNDAGVRRDAGARVSPGVGHEAR